MLITGTTTRSALFGKRLMSYNSSTQSSSPMSVNSNKTDNSEETRKSTRPTKQRRSIIDAQLSSIESNEVKFEYDENNDEDYRPGTATPKPLLSIQLRQRAQQRTSPTIQNECSQNKEPYIDDDIIQPCNSIKRSKRKNHRVPQTDGSNLCLYRWPLQPDSPIYMLQDQLIQFLCFKSFKRKYNSGLQRRRVEPKERIYLKSKRKLRSDQVYMNSIALQVDEVIKLLNVDFPNHCRVLSERLEITLQANDQSNEQQTETDERSKSPLVPFKNRKNLANSLNVVASTSQLDILSDRFLAWPKLKKFKSFAEIDNDRHIDESKSSQRVASDFNSYLLERRKHLCKCINLQTMQMNRATKRNTTVSQRNKIGSFPVQLMNGQYFDGYVRRLTSDELFQLPLDTVFVDNKEMLAERRSTTENLINRKVMEQRVPCGICNKAILFRPLRIRCLENLDDHPYMQCSTCQSISHIQCIEMSIEMMKVAKEYNWQCMNCKACSKCNQLSDEDMIMFCDRCDRGYHVYCVGLIEIPKGSWICDPCTQETGLGKLSSSNNTNINGITGLSFSTVTSKQKKRCPRLPPVDYSPYLTNNNKSNKLSVSLSIPHFKDIKPRIDDSLSLSAKLQNQIYSQPKRHSRSGNHKRKRHR